jgi:hypothetical protein
MLQSFFFSGGAVAQLGARLDGIEEVVGSNPIGSTKNSLIVYLALRILRARPGHVFPSQRASGVTT